MTGCAIEGEDRGAGLIAHPASIEPKIGRTAGGKRTIVTEIGNADLLARLGGGAIPDLRDRLIPWEREGERPAIDGDGTGIGENDVHAEAADPLTCHLVAHLTRPTQRSGRGDLRRRGDLRGR